jgi:hypothetical protein
MGVELVLEVQAEVEGAGGAGRRGEGDGEVVREVMRSCGDPAEVNESSAAAIPSMRDSRCGDAQLWSHVASRRRDDDGYAKSTVRPQTGHARWATLSPMRTLTRSNPEGVQTQTAASRPQAAGRPRASGAPVADRVAALVVADRRRCCAGRHFS